jgi:hypothetical protein
MTKFLGGARDFWGSTSHIEYLELNGSACRQMYSNVSAQLWSRASMIVKKTTGRCSYHESTPAQCMERAAPRYSR